MAPTPTRGRCFRLRDRALDRSTGEATFAYDLDGEPFEERVTLPVGDGQPSDAGLDLLLDVAHVVIGTSYYKLSAPTTLAIERPVTAAVVDLARQTYDEGLRELAVVNGLPVPLETEILAQIVAPPPEPGPVTSTARGTASGCARPLLPIGGGKDSAAVLSLLPASTAVTISATPVQRRLTAAAGVPLLEVARTLEPTLAERTAAGGLNGHIPITAVNSALSVLVAALGGHDCVVFGNERSANEPTRTVAGIPVNHQHSKSFAFEEGFARAIAPGGIRCFSALRRLSGLSIAGIVAADRRLRGEFLSCNRAFKRSRRPEDPQVWCLECPKCLSTVLAFAPFLTPAEVIEVFGANPLDDPALADAFGELWDVEAKPFECVAELAESAVAMAWLSRSGDWADAAVVRRLGPGADAAAGELGATMDDLLRPDGNHLVPAALASAVEERAASVRPRA